MLSSPRQPTAHTRRRAAAWLAILGAGLALSSCLPVPAVETSTATPPPTLTRAEATKPKTSHPHSTSTTVPVSTTTTSALTSTTMPGSTTTAAPTTSSTAVPVAEAQPPCGGPVPDPEGGQWECTFADEFDGTSLDRSRWVPQETSKSGFHSGPECFVDDPDNVSVAGGTLRLTVREESGPFACTFAGGGYTTRYTSGSVSTYRLFSQTYGRFEVRAKLPGTSIRGLQESFWLWPDDPTRFGAWPRSGEIDIAEVYSLHSDRAIPYIHYVPAVYDPNVTNNYCLIEDIDEFHTYAVEWTSTAITVIYDGQTCLVDRWNPAAPLQRPEPFNQPFIIALTQALGIGANAFDPATTPLPATTEVDHVRIWG